MTDTTSTKDLNLEFIVARHDIVAHTPIHYTPIHWSKLEVRDLSNIYGVTYPAPTTQENVPQKIAQLAQLSFLLAHTANQWLPKEIFIDK